MSVCAKFECNSLSRFCATVAYKNTRKKEEQLVEKHTQRMARLMTRLLAAPIMQCGVSINAPITTVRCCLL